ncbi:MAG TPA: dimethylsulfonioproprionate lyase family protein [Steroidobacteraceae bacterium]|nr:dimethylsulfonioproprionate lyase family protein [Steroidobacteraceae bacterium]
MPAPDGDLIECARQFLSADAPALARAFLDLWPPRHPRRAVAPRPIAAARWLALAARQSQAPAGSLLERLAGESGSLAWRQSYGTGDLEQTFFDNYGWVELIGPQGLAPSDRLACGVLVLGPHTLYPPHRHEAYEVYVPLAGTAEWQRGTEGWLIQAPGSAIEHASEVPHAMRTAAEPLVALYLWRGRDLAAGSRLDAR